MVRCLGNLLLPRCSPCGTGVVNVPFTFQRLHSPSSQSLSFAITRAVSVHQQRTITTICIWLMFSKYLPRCLVVGSHFANDTIIKYSPHNIIEWNIFMAECSKVLLNFNQITINIGWRRWLWGRHNAVHSGTVAETVASKKKNEPDVGRLLCVVDSTTRYYLWANIWAMIAQIGQDLCVDAHSKHVYIDLFGVNILCILKLVCGHGAGGRQAVNPINQQVVVESSRPSK